MNAWLEIVSPGLGVSVQDAGRSGHRAIGVPLSGALDPTGLAAANLLAGNEAGAAGLEVLLAGPVLRAVDAPLRIALGGSLAGRLIPRDGPPRPVAAWSALTLQAGDTLHLVNAPGAGYLAVSGGLQVMPALGSRASYPRAGLGPPPLQAGQRLPCRQATDRAQPDLQADSLLHPDGPIRVIPGPQAGHFTPSALATFLSEPYRIGQQRDRMGIRLDGPPLAHSELGADIVSDGVAPGAIQVPADGRPILLLADCQTVGGYPKIATVIRADLPRIAHLQAGDSLRFAAVDARQAAAARADLASRLQAWQASIRPRGGLTDSAALLAANLAGAAVRGDEDPLQTQP
ncbi:5-oxoprolinase subunit C family protein [Zoogloea dura]|uniref:Biotin-dependent carboxyltransferase family protein n=1 Tax=Zoogloea dura TaxID=2728840 RepID=A0A848FZF5_9RHOO|nr:biotin-dependent carboxyltransferase family protein [Zoogloea dura]NML25298.1 biotin-dependent carboxyltransferase family protein [Zoogloea dura]